ncbi:MAG TPA: hypothetical protein VLL74_03170, partial [Methanoregula sp.]|nr:hypothetical protein [Methanoregula sp.]
MGSPYLNSGETIVLTTNRVVADALAYDIMLTTERIFLIDNQNVRFEPRIIPLSAILSVQGGKTPAHDPAITLLFRPSVEGSARQPLNLVFSQNPGEMRKSERDDWIRTLIQLSIARQEKDAAAVAPAVPETAGDTGLRPAVRHWVAPEKVRPLSNVAGRRTAPAPVTIIPDEVEGSLKIPGTAPKDVAIPLQQTESEGPATGITPVPGTAPGIRAPPAPVIIPQIIEELLPDRTSAIPPAEHQPEPEKESDQEQLRKSIQSTIQSLTGMELPAPEPPRDTEPVEMPVPDSERISQPEQPALVPSHTGDLMQVETAPESPRDTEPVEMPVPDSESVSQPEQPALVP